jgi:hypothetical protein
MRRTLRIILNAATVLSLLLCAVTVVLWIRSYWIEDSLGFGKGYAALSLIAFRGEVGCEFMQCTADSRLEPAPHLWVRHFHQTANAVDGRDFEDVVSWRSRPLPNGYHDMLGFRFHVDVPMYGNVMAATTRGVAVPAWFLALCAAVLPARAAWRLKRRCRRQREGQCQACGYDLRATPDRCPECGAIPATIRNR